MMNIKIMVCCHKKMSIPKLPILYPIQLGADLSSELYEGFLYDNDGENISAKNKSYCELTAQYWAWKNCDADFFGFFHYRRFLVPAKNIRKPYIIKPRVDAATLDSLGFGNFAALIENYDIVCPNGEQMYVSVRKHYANAPFHHEKDLALAEEIVRGLYPEYTEALERYFDGTVHYFGNIFVMKKDVFYEYCEWLFPILEQFDRRADLSGYGEQEMRVDGYIAERLFGVYYTQRKDALKTVELPRVIFEEAPLKRLRQKLINFFLPPGSSKRYFVKALLYHH